jgi:transposase-like protein
MRISSEQIPMQDLKSLQDAVKWFADPMHCVEAVKQMRWPDGRILCPFCSCDRRYWLAKQMRWKCAGCRKQFTVKLGTVFEDSPIPLDKWLVAVWLIANCKNGISSYELARHIGITQKSAWFVLHRIRFVLANGGWPQMGGEDSGPVEIDEAYVGGKLKNMHANRRAKLKLANRGGDHKTPVFGMLDRETRTVRAKVLKDVKRETLQAEILREIAPGSTVYTDGATAYDDLKVREFVHETVSHYTEYVRGQVHTQGIENFWSLLKRGLTGTYVSVEPFHLGKYVDEQVFRYNNRATKENPLNDQDRFMALLSQISGKRLTYAELTGKERETPGGEREVF